MDIKAKKDGKYGYISYNNEVLIRFEYSFVNFPTFGTVAVKKNKKFGFVSLMGEEIVLCVYDTVYQFEKNGKATVVKKGNWGYVLKDGTEKIK